MVASDLLWQLTRNNSCFIKKQKNIPVFTAEPKNLTGLNSFKYSGLANKSAAGLSLQLTTDKKQTVILETKAKATAASKKGAAKQTVQTGIKKTLKKGPAAIEAQLTKVGRRDLVDVANRKLGMLLKTCRKAKVQTKNARIVIRDAKKADAKAATAEKEEQE